MPIEVWEIGWSEFRSRYPRHEAWPRAEKAYRALWKAGKLPALEIVSVAIKCQQRPGGCLQRVVTKDGRDTRPLPASWLNAERWHDEIEPPLKDTAAQAMGMPEGDRRTPESIDQESKERALECHRNQEMEREAARAEFFRQGKKARA
jgi:hypothetical protein